MPNVNTPAGPSGNVNKPIKNPTATQPASTLMRNQPNMWETVQKRIADEEKVRNSLRKFNSLTASENLRPFYAAGLAAADRLHKDAELAAVFSRARETVRPIIDRERRNEIVPSRVFDFVLR